MKVISIDHLVLTVASIARTVAFYERVLGMQAQVFGPENRVALIFGQQQNLQKINLHELGQEFEPKARLARPGTADLCFIVDDFDAIATKLAAENVTILAGPLRRTGANGAIRSIYIRDPDDNLIELSSYGAAGDAE